MKALVLLLGLVGCAFGQTKAVDPCAGIPHCTTDPEVLKHGCWNCDELNEKYKNVIAPLKCDKYEFATFGMKDGVFTEVCAPIMHEVTEKEWQELMERLKKLESPPISGTGMGKSHCVDKDGKETLCVAW